LHNTAALPSPEAQPTTTPSALQDVSNVLWGVAKLTKERSSSLAPPTAAAGAPPAPVPEPAGAAAAADGGDADPADEAPPGSPPASPASSAAAEATADAFAAPGDAVPQLGAPADGAAAPGEATVAAQALLAAPPVPADGAPAAATAPPVTPLLSLTQVQALLTHLCANLSRAMVQTISNSLWAVVVLQHEHSWCMCGSLMQVQLLLHTFCQQPREALPGHIQPVIRCMSQLATACAVHNGDAWLMWQPPVLQRLLGHLFSQRSHMEQHHVSSVLRDVAQVACLLMLLQRRKLEASAKAEGRPPLGPRAADDMLSALAAGAGPPDTASTMLALGILRPQLSDMGLLPSVQHLCGMLSLMASHNQVRVRPAIGPFSGHCSHPCLCTTHAALLQPNATERRRPVLYTRRNSPTNQRRDSNPGARPTDRLHAG
jgi:hypothetical protein